MELPVLANFSAATVPVELDEAGWADAELLLRDPMPDGTDLLSPPRPWEARVLRGTDRPQVPA